MLEAITQGIITLLEYKRWRVGRTSYNAVWLFDSHQINDIGGGGNE